MQLDDMVLVSVDDHVVEPPDLFEGRLPADYADLAPKLIRKDAGTDVWVYDGAEMPNIGLNAVAGRPPEEYGIEPTSFDEMRPGCYDIDERVKDMNANGVLGSMCFPSFPQFCGQLFAPHRGQGRSRSRCCRRTTTGTSTSGAARTRAASSRSSLPPIWDPEVMAAEVRRIAGEGLPRGHVLGEPVEARLPELPLRPLGSVLAGVRDEGTVVCLHIGSSSQLVITAPDAPIDVLITLHPINIVQAAADLLWSPVLRKFPDLQVALSEGGIGWIPYFLERIDYTYDRHHALDRPGLRRPAAERGVPRAHHHLLHRRPGRRRDCGTRSTSTRSRGSATTRTPTRRGRTRPSSCWKQLRPACPTTTSTRSRTRNAMRHFRYDPFSALGGREQCTVGALRAQAEGWDVSIVARGIKATGTGAMDLLKMAQGKN